MKRVLGLSVFGIMATLFAVGSADAQLFARRVVVAVPVQASPVQGKAEAGAGKKLGPVACAVVRMHLREEYRKKGMGLVERIKKANEASDDVINGLVPDAEKVAGKKFGAIGDGTIIQAIIDFLNSPAGKALIDALIQLLIHALG